MGKTDTLTRALAAASMAACLALPARAGSCEDLVNLKLPDTQIVSAVAVPAGDFAATPKQIFPLMPAFCRVTAEVKNAPDSDIKVEVWLPGTWKGVFHGTGNGGYAGTLSADYAEMAGGLRRGYATATTDMGTAPSNDLDGDPLIGHPQKWKDWGLLSTHVMTVTGKAIAKAYYGAEAKRAYFTGCSTGGQQALIEAQYYPDDYDGIISGAPVINRTWGHVEAVWGYQAAHLQPGHVLSAAKLTLLHEAALKVCGGKSNGLTSDPFIADPMACKFDPGKLVCKGADTGQCLTKAEVETAKALYSGPTDHNGKPLFYGWLPGSELNGWAFLQAPFNRPDEPSFDGMFKWVFGADWNWRDFDTVRDMPKMDAALGSSLNGATTGNLAAFEARGGKLIMFQGWADPIVPQGQTLAFYSKLEKQFGAKTRNFARLFMAPGVAHCGGGQGPAAFNSALGGPPPPDANAGDDIFYALTDWVENGAAPARILATKYVDNAPAKGIAMQRPLCPWPQKAWYKGKGDTNDASNFVCSATRPKPR